jgi:hypothetical protein
MVFVVALAVTGPAPAALACDGQGAEQNRAGAPPPAVMAMMGLVLLATGAVTRRSTIERA